MSHNFKFHGQLFKPPESLDFIGLREITTSFHLTHLLANSLLLLANYLQGFAGNLIQ